MNLLSWLRKSAPKTCTGCGHERGPHRHYRPGSNCTLCGCPRWQRAVLSRPVPSEQAHYEGIRRMLDGPPPTSRDPLVVREPGNPQQEGGAR